MIFSIKAFPTFSTNLETQKKMNKIQYHAWLEHVMCTNLRFIAAMNDKMQIEMLFSFESFFAYGANVRPFRAMTEFVTFQMLFSL